jgi:hypothetical protein
MYRDNSLIPLEAMRIAALGALAEGSFTYAALAADVRHFTGLIVGPTLDLMGSSIEVLRAEGLIRSELGDGPDAPLVLTEKGRETLLRLLQGGISPMSLTLSRLIVALKMRFLHLLPPAERTHQIELLIEHVADERDRHTALGAPEGSLFHQWQSFEVEMLDRYLDWLRQFAARCGEA